MSNSTIIKKYAEQLRIEGILKYKIILLTTVHLYSYLEGKAPEKHELPSDIGKHIKSSITPDSLKPVEQYLDKYFKDSFWEELAEFTLNELIVYEFLKRNEEIEKFFNTLSIHSHSLTKSDNINIIEHLVSDKCASYACEKLLKEIQVENLSLEKLEPILGIKATKPTVSQRLYANGNKFEAAPTYPPVHALMQAIPYSYNKNYNAKSSKGWNEAGVYICNFSDSRTIRIYLVGKDEKGQDILLEGDKAWNIIKQFQCEHRLLYLILLQKAFIEEFKPFRLSIRDDVIEVIEDKRKNISLEVKLREHAKNVKLLDNIAIEVNWFEGKGEQRININSNFHGTGIIKAATFPSILQIDSPKKDIIFEVVLSEALTGFFQKNIKQFCYVPKELLELNLKFYKIEFSIGIYVLFNERIRKNNHYKMSTLIDEAVASCEPELVKKAQGDKYAGRDFKKRLIKAFNFLKDIGWQVELKYSDQGFNGFYQGSASISPLKPQEPEIILEETEINHFLNLNPSSNNPITGGQLKEARNRQGLSLRGLASSVGVSYETIRKWEKAPKKPIPPEYQRQVWKALNH